MGSWPRCGQPGQLLRADGDRQQILPAEVLQDLFAELAAAVIAGKEAQQAGADQDRTLGSGFHGLLERAD